MSKVFPSMHSKPAKYSFFVLIVYWILLIIVLPTNLPLLAAGLWERWEISAWFQIIYYLLNALILAMFMKSYLKEEWFMVTTDFRFYLKHAGLTIAMSVGIVVLTLATVYFGGVSIRHMANGLPLVEMTVSHTPLALLEYRPLFGTLAVTFCTPITMCILYYCFAFAPIAYKRPWLAYLLIPVVTVLPHIVDIIWRDGAQQALSMYLIQLPVHLLACWSYQKTDNVWTPIFTLAGTNLILSLLQIFLIL